MAGECGRRARRRVSGVRDEAEEQRWLAQQYDFLIEDVKKWVAEKLWRRHVVVATSVQAFYRGNVGRRLSTQQWRGKNAATLLQSSARGKFARNAARGRRGERRERQRQAAAVRIQAVQRGRAAREEVGELYGRLLTGALAVQRHQRGRSGRAQAAESRQRVRAATAWQAAIRGKLGRREAAWQLDGEREAMERELAALEREGLVSRKCDVRGVRRRQQIVPGA